MTTTIKTIPLGDQHLDLSTPVVMGILNVTPDSFHDGGKYLREGEIIRRAEEIVEQGAGIIDVGAYSTRPGAAFVEEQEELSRLSFAVELIRKYHPGVPVSIDTFRANVVREIVRCLGPVVVNDISGGTLDADMFATVAERQLPYCLMHMQGTPQDMQIRPHYRDVVEEVFQFLQQQVHRLHALGCHHLLIDPGFGFGKSLAHNYTLLHHLDRFHALGHPLLVGISRKSMIWKLFNTSPAEALNGTTVLNTLALAKGAAILRVHDVREAVETVKIMQTLQAQP